MTKVEVRLQGSDVPEGSFASKPRVLYRAGTRYCRVEEAPDPENGIHGLLIVNEPDAWQVNLLPKEARHLVDAGPSFKCHLPIFPGGAGAPGAAAKKPVPGLEFGLEIEYFTAQGATPRPGGVLQGQQTTTYVLDADDTKIALFTYGTPERPLAVARTQGNSHAIFWYSGYGQVPFDPKLFAKPEGVKIEEQKP
jgi:hypothetical protein